MPKIQGRPPVAGFIFSFLFISLMGMTAMPDNINDFYKILPDTIAGWKKADPPDLYTPKNLSNYIDGGAELFLSYNFQNALALKYLDPAGDEITIDIFDMGSAPDAFGVFAHSRETIDTRVGQGCEYAAGLLTFWKDRYYVSILAYPETAEKREVVFKLGQAIAAAVASEGSLPPIISLLPAESLLPETVHYFHHYIWLNSFYFVSNENVLNIGPDTPAALGKYRKAGATFFLLIVRYPDAARAEAAGGQFRQKLLDGAADGMSPTKEGRWTGLQYRGDLVSVVFNAPDKATIRAIFANIKK
ncbi:MAG: hypothetical protein NT147_05675 [Candidatus Aminicenantes bacterium]|nr:hypothetical protein [Candidatus Aminicenantes bacterium]